MADPGPLFPLLHIDRLRMETDGEGVTTLVAGAGCPLCCRWCLNKRLLAEKKPEWITPGTLLARTRIDDLYFQATGGGLCFGGGEALLHADFIAAFRALTGGGWKLTAETSLHVPPAALETALGCVDAWIVDVKTADPAVYRAYTGGDNRQVFENLRTLAASVPPARVLVRIPLIPGFNDDADRRKTAAAVRELGFTKLDLFDYIIKEDDAASRT